MKRVMELAWELVKTGQLASVEFGDITIADVVAAREVLIVGTTLNVVSVRSFDGNPVADGVPGPVGTALDRMISDDISNNAALRTLY
jgi:branched-chain amino acid aminotransferase